MNRCLLVGLVVVVVAGCLPQASSDVVDTLPELPGAAPTTSVTPSTAPVTPTTTGAPSPEVAACATFGETASFWPTPLPPAAQMPPGSRMDEIRRRGVLKVGVDDNTLGFALRSPEDQIEGFEVDLAAEVAARIFGVADGHPFVETERVTTDTKLQSVDWPDPVDLAIDANSMSCDRWGLVDFSTEYFTATQKLLLRKDSTIHEPADLADHRVCVTMDSSSGKTIEGMKDKGELPKTVALVRKRYRTDCLAALQQGEADAYFSHDSFLYGMLLQDPTLEVRDVITKPSHYGIAISKRADPAGSPGRLDHEFLRFVNAVLAELRQNGTLQWMYDQLNDTIPQLGAEIPQPTYRDGP